MNLAIRLRKLSPIIPLFLLLSVASLASGEGTRTWEQSKFDELTKGTAKGVAIRSAGGLELAPAFKSISTTPSTYIWSIAADQGGNLYAATGAPARVYRITPDGKSTPIFEPQELQVQALVVGEKSVIYAATNPDGKVYRIENRARTAAGVGKDVEEKPKSTSEFSASVYFEPGTKYIWDLALDDAGNLYAATGDRGEIFRVTPKGVHSVFFKSDEAHIRVLALDSKGNLIAGSDGSGLVYRISPNGEAFVLYSAPKKEITALAIDKAGNIYAAGAGEKRPGAAPSVPTTPPPAPMPASAATQPQPGLAISNPAPGGGLYASTSNLGKLFLLGATPESEGSYESDVFDAHIFSRWGRAEFRGAGNVELSARSGNVDNPDRNWSTWKKVDLQKEAEVSVPPARFIQWKAVLRAGNPAPRLDSVTLNYLPKNVAPDFDDVTVQVGVRYQSLPKPAGTDTNVPASGAPQQRFEVPPPVVHDRDAIGVKWGIHDDNDDQMVYSVYYRGDGETRWLLLKDNLTDKFYSLDASLLPDGGYTIKVVASDSPSHSPEQALTAEKESARFEVDTTPPQIQNLTAGVDGGKIHVNFRAADNFSSIKRAEYSVDAGDWQFVEPVGQLSDAKTEAYDFRIAPPVDSDPPGAKPPISPAQGVEHVVVVRVYDRYDNMVSAKTVIRGK